MRADSNQQGSKKMRVMYVLSRYPEISETYINSEMEALRDECDICVVSLNPSQASPCRHLPFQCLSDAAEIVRAIAGFRPQVLHTHYLGMVELMGYLTEKTGVPFTVRSHSFDTLNFSKSHWRSHLPLSLTKREHFPRFREIVQIVNSDLCAGVLVFPFARPLLRQWGISESKLVDCYPVVDYQRFHDRGSNGHAIMNLGACSPKKKMENFVDLALGMPERRFNLYPVASQTEKICAYNRSRGNLVNILAAVEPEKMPAEYKRHEWLVYTACPEINTVGWPVAVAEAQASGVGVCFPNLRSDLRTYVGNAGFLYNSLTEARSIVSQPFPDELREIGFENARKSDIQGHKHKLLHLWEKANPAEGYLTCRLQVDPEHKITPRFRPNTNPGR